MATLGAFLTAEPIEPIPPSLAKALYLWIQSIEENDAEDSQVTELLFAVRTIVQRTANVTHTSPRVGLKIEPKWDLREARVLGLPLYADTDLFKSLSANRHDRNDKAVSGEEPMKRKEAAIRESGLRLPRLCLVGKTHQDTLPSQSSVAMPPDDEPPRKRRKYSESSESVRRCGPNDTALPAWILEYKSRVGPKLARTCFGKASVYLAASFEMAGTFLATAMAGQYFIRLFALGDKHLAVEIDFAKWPGCPPQATLSELLRREDIACAFFAGHCMDVTKEFDAESEPVFTPNSAVKTFFEPILLAHGILKDQPSDQLMTALDPPGAPDDLWAQLSEWKSSGPSASSSLTLVPDQHARLHATTEDTCGMPVDKSTSFFADFRGNPDLSNCTGLSKVKEIADEDGLCLGDSAVTLSGYLEDDEEDVDDFYWDRAPEHDIKFTAVSHDTFERLLQCARDRFNRSNARTESATAP